MVARERVSLEPAYVLHHREYRDTSRILDVFSARHGRITLFARGARGPKSRLASLLMPFRPLLVSWTGRGEAAQLAGAEPDGEALPLGPKHLMSAFYLNELIINLTTRHDPQPQLFDDYARALRRLCVEVQPEVALRVFEKRLLECIGYGLELDVVSGSHYQYRPSEGLYEVREDAPGAYAGRTLLALREEALDDPQSLDTARRVLRQALDHCLEGRELRTRNVARSMARRGNA
ncbi:MAG TPA: DNA repair protein RecO [Steroidobacteraceae bacterium]|nr:DNA repair protein RecO [Steroidobacteraceae bacterium]